MVKFTSTSNRLLGVGLPPRLAGTSEVAHECTRKFRRGGCSTAARLGLQDKPHTPKKPGQKYFLNSLYTLFFELGLRKNT